MCVTLLPDVLAALRFQFPSSELSVEDLRSDAGHALVGDGQLDVALTADYGRFAGDDRVTAHHLLSDPLLVLLPDTHPLAAEVAPAGTDLAQLSDATWVSGPPGRPSRLQLDDAAAEVGFVPHVPFQTESYDVAQALIASGVAVGLIPKLALKRLPGVTVSALRSPLTREVYAVLPSSVDHIPLAAEFLSLLRHVAAASSR